ncbi:hypothetical protein [Roseovarius phycicola]|uniref:Uncharacterized protein n=1 Tax=Roseovarius phycicola TaxID=3080976 RepID=A0ABZ2HI33_9RHOB
MADLISHEGVEALFTRADGTYLFARWGRPLVPVVFGTDDRTLEIVKGAVEAVVLMAGHSMAETDPELGVNLMFFFFRDWDELTEVPDLDRMVPDLGPLVERLKAAGANQYRIFRFDESGAIKASFVFLRMDGELSKVPADTLALAQVVQTIVLWSDTAFVGRSPLAQAPEGKVILRPDIGAVIRASYDPVMPVVAQDPSHALRLAARVKQV